MSTPEAVTYNPRLLPLRRRLLVRLAVAVGHLIAAQPPRRIRRVLGWLGRRAEPATFDEAKAAREAVVSVSLACAGREGCLVRSIATVLVCRAQGKRPTWCVGVRRLPPFGAHAWVEVNEVPVGEPYPPDYFRKFFTVP
ncbi:MAG: lasso peptide biosynthesis B2 protein [Actinomycetota bacterium]|nr:lasso peptide biosynthesis B2 protein [Actinomycetota bacterium]